MLSKFKEEREKRKMAPPSSGPSGGGPASVGLRSGGDHRSSRGGEDYRDRDRGYDRQSSRYESVNTSWHPRSCLLICALQRETKGPRALSESQAAILKYLAHGMYAYGDVSIPKLLCGNEITMRIISDRGIPKDTGLVTGVTDEPGMLSGELNGLCVVFNVDVIETDVKRSFGSCHRCDEIGLLTDLAFSTLLPHRHRLRRSAASVTVVHGAAPPKYL